MTKIVQLKIIRDDQKLIAKLEKREKLIKSITDKLPNLSTERLEELDLLTEYGHILNQPGE